MIDKARVGQKIFYSRKKMGITQDCLSKLVNVTPQAISKWENGVTLPDICLLPKLADLFQISIDELLCERNGRNVSSGQSEGNRVMLTGLTYYPGTPSVVSCIKSGLHYLGIHVSLGWISVPYAFMLNINENVSPMGPEFWNDNGCFDELVRNCGGIIETLSGHKSDKDIVQKRRAAWDLIRDAIDKGLPCYAWELDKPTFYMIAGYDETGYYYIDPDSIVVSGPKPYQELCESEWGVLEIHVIHLGSISDSLKTLKDVFEYAVNVGNPEVYPPNPGYRMGVEAYRVWWEAIEKGDADLHGIACNASFWAKCKSLAALFLKEGKLRIGIMEDLFDRAIAHYEGASRSLDLLSQLYPSGAVDAGMDDGRGAKAVGLIKAAQKSEMNGLAEIREILNRIYKIW